MINRINAARRAAGLAPTAENGRLGQAAAKHAADLAANPWLIDSGRFHEGSDGSTVRARVVAEGYEPAWFGEVVGWGFADVDPTVTAGEYDRMVNWWLASPPHRAMLLSPHYDEAGAGYVYRPGSQWGHYYCVVFGKRAGVVNPPAPPKPPGDVVYVPVVVGGREVPPTGVVDLLGYLRGDGRAYRVTNADGGSEVFQTQAEGDRFYQVKAWSDLSVVNWEEFIVAGDLIGRDVDTSPGGGRFYRLFGAPWVRRWMRVGESFTRPKRVQFYQTHDCAPLAAYSGDVTDTITLVARHEHYTFRTLMSLPDVVELRWEQGGERYWYAEDWGLVAWERAHQDANSPRWSAIAELRPDVGRLARLRIDCL